MVDEEKNNAKTAERALLHSSECRHLYSSECHCRFHSSNNKDGDRLGWQKFNE
jgi:hypothetical protein